ncbi:MAG: hypothetical protein MR433_11150, partial [Coriobacteriaceae bacterium]|nr:hypothetical protein [Coriobacteriaceae bacterium]
MYDDWAQWDSSIQDSGLETDPTHEFTLEAGDYTLYVDVIGPDGKTILPIKPLTVGAPMLDMSLHSDVSGGTGTVNVKALFPMGGGAGYKFNYVWQYEDSWAEGDWDSLVMETGSHTQDGVWSFTPSRLGRYNVFVDF